MIEVPATLQRLFVAAGWRPGRTVRLSPTIPADHPAASILTNFGGLRVGTTGPGKECATSDVAFQELPMEDATRKVWAALLRTELIGIAEVHNEHGALYIDRAGRCYQGSLIHDAFSFEGASFNEAIERLLLGRRSRPMLRPDQTAIRLYGDEIRADDPRVYKWQ
jgi:SUKH-3 immunity protein